MCSSHPSVATASRRAPFRRLVRGRSPFSRPLERHAADTAELVSDARSLHVPTRSHGSRSAEAPFSVLGCAFNIASLKTRRRDERSDEKTMSFTTVFIGAGFTARLS
jgi:hypothetical protein